ncbi:MAG: deoxyribodipyrimidine photo-lyase, partial [Gammaproteobacteria bacterium]|nr:deoxyribodipyrimidine photo-lyase [Gammaproteobacteria bacterium]
AACAAGQAVRPLVIRPGHDGGRWSPGAASRWWLHGSLRRLAADLERRGARLLLRSGDPVGVLAALARESGAAALYWSRAYEPGEAALERRLRQELGG